MVEMDYSSILVQAQEYGSTLMEKALAGDPTSIALAALAVLLTIGLFAGVGSLIWRYLKSLLLLGIVGLSLYLAAPELLKRFSAGGMGVEVLAIGAIALVAGLFALLFAFKQTKSTHAEATGGEAALKKTAPEKAAAGTQEKTLLEHLSAAKDRNLTSVISLLIIAQFGIFTSKTISAPNADVGMMLVGGFLLAAFFFIRNTYSSYKKGLAHLMVAAIAAFAISIVLGHYWGQIPFETLLSQEYFATDAAVAFITSIAVSLLMGNNK